jgi:beta-N-acetylhexosaminidase
VEAALARLSLEQRVGQMFMGYVFGTSADDRAPRTTAANRRVHGTDTAGDAVRRHGLGGVIYLDGGRVGPHVLPDNIVEAGQVSRLSAGLQTSSDVPLLIATDQEQGAVTRVHDGVTLLPGQMAQAASGVPAYVRDAAHITGADLRSLGINVNFAPVADVNINPANPVIAERSFGDDPAVVSRLTAAAVEGYTAAGVASAAKHFPGHGSTSVDSHLGLPQVTHSRTRLDDVDLPPFRAAIGAGVPMVMVGHLAVPAVDSNEPASLSRPVVEGLLRNELGFQGVVVTDALVMAAVTQRYPPGEAAVRAVMAENDLLLMPPRLVEARDAVLAAVGKGRIPAERIEESVRRLLRLKWRLAHTYPQSPGDPAATAARIAGGSVTLLDMECGALPIRPGAAVSVAGPGAAAEQLRAALAARGVTPSAGPGTDAHIELAGSGRPVWAAPRTIVVSIGTPYQPPAGATAWLATYSADPASMAALAAVLTGATAPAGHLPVSATLQSGRPLPPGSGLAGFPSC